MLIRLHDFDRCWSSVLLLLSLVVAMPTTAVPAEVSVARATGTESISFSRDLAQVLVQHCIRCHGADRPRARLSLSTFQRLFRGGDNGAPLQPGSPDDSLLLQKLKGTADGQRMPQGDPPLDDDVIARFGTWIREGARFDGPDPKQNVREIAAISRAQRATHEQLRADRSALAAANWRLVMPDDDPEQIETSHFLLLGNVSHGDLSHYGAVAESLVPKIARIFRVPDDVPLVKGAITLFFFASKYEYGEMGRMVEKRDLEPTSKAHFRYSIVDAYAALYAGSTDPDSLEAMLAQQIAGLYVSSLGNAPDWFRRGAAAAVAARLAPRSDTVASWNSGMTRAFGRLQEPADFLKGNTTAADSDLLAYSFVRFLMSDSRRFQRMVGLLRDGADFEAAFTQGYGALPEQVTPVWARRTASESRPRGRRRTGR